MYVVSAEKEVAFPLSFLSNLSLVNSCHPWILVQDIMSLIRSSLKMVWKSFISWAVQFLRSLRLTLSFALVVPPQLISHLSHTKEQLS